MALRQLQNVTEIVSIFILYMLSLIWDQLLLGDVLARHGC